MGPVNGGDVNMFFFLSVHESENNKRVKTLPMKQLFSPHVKGQTIL